MVKIGMGHSTDGFGAIIEDSRTELVERYPDRICGLAQQPRVALQPCQGSGTGPPACGKTAEPHDGAVFTGTAPAIGAIFTAGLPLKTLREGL